MLNVGPYGLPTGGKTPAPIQKILFDCVVAPTGGDYATVGAALAAGKVRIFVRNGTYLETGENTIPSNCIIIGESQDGAIIQLVGTTNKRFLMGSGVAVNNVTIEHLTLASSTPTSYLISSAQIAGSAWSNLAFRYVTFDGGGVTQGYNTSCAVSGYLHFENCRAKNMGSAAGLFWARGTSGTLTEVKAIGNIIVDTTASSLVVVVNGTTVDKILVANNLWSANTSDFFSLIASTAATALIEITGNIVTGMKFAGFAQNYSGRAFIANNYFQAASTSYSFSVGLYAGGTGVVYIANNYFKGWSKGYSGNSQGDGYFLIGNTYYGCTTGLDLPSGVDNHVIRGNHFIACTTNISNLGANNQLTGNTGLSAVDDSKLVLMKNTSGGTINAGDVVVLKAAAAGDEVTTSTTAGDKAVFGMVFDASIVNNAYGYIQTAGKTVSLKANGTVAIAIGDYLAVSTTAKIAYKGTIGTLAVVGDTAFAVALEAYAVADNLGVLDALLITPFKL